jgi:hypothetical protein
MTSASPIQFALGDNPPRPTGARTERGFLSKAAFRPNLRRIAQGRPPKADPRFQILALDHRRQSPIPSYSSVVPSDLHLIAPSSRPL